MTGYFSSMGSALGMNSDQTQGALAGTFGAVGLGLDIFGTMGAMKSAQAETQTQIEETEIEMQQNQVRRAMMNVDYNRRVKQSIREADLARATGKAAAVNQGGSVMGTQASSGYSGGQAQASGQEAYNFQQLGFDVNLGNQMFDLTNQLDQEKIKMAQEQQQAETSQGWAKIGGAVLSEAGNFAKLAMLI